jgi:hypothetical protein
VARASSSHGVVATGADGAPVSCVLEEGRSEPRRTPRWSPLSWPTVGTVALRVEAMKAAPESFLLGERLRTQKQSAMNSRLPKRTVLPREKPLHIKHSPSVETASTDE